MSAYRVPESKPTVLSDTSVLSFDLWLTLIKSNGTGFKTARNALLGSRLAPHINAPTFDKIVRTQDRAADKDAELSGRDINFSGRVIRIAKAVGAAIPTPNELEDLYKKQSELSEVFPPTLMHPRIPEALDSLAGRYELGIISNTGFIHGQEMRQILSRLGVAHYFSHLIFSNEVGYAKPNGRIFETLMQESGVAAYAITHIGDNWHADVEGALSAGMQAILADTPEVILGLAAIETGAN